MGCELSKHTLFCWVDSQTQADEKLMDDFKIMTQRTFCWCLGYFIILHVGNIFILIAEVFSRMPTVRVQSYLMTMHSAKVSSLFFLTTEESKFCHLYDYGCFSLHFSEMHFFFF